MSIVLPHNFCMAAITEGFVRRIAAPAESGFGSAVGGVAIGAPDLGLPFQDERSTHRGNYLEPPTVCCGFGRESIFSQDTGVSEVRLLMTVVAERLVPGFSAAAEGDAGVF